INIIDVKCNHRCEGFYLYKLPHLHHEPVQEGLKYLFMDGESEGWMDGKTLVNDSQSAVGRTVGPLYEVQQLKINQPHIYDCSIPASLAAAVPAMAQLCKHTLGRWDNTSSSPSNRSVSLLSLAGTEFINFAKGASFANDLYHSWVAPTLQSDLLVQFWRRSTGILPSDCSPSWKVLNIDLISPGQRVTFKATGDHSKWAVSMGGSAGSGTSSGWVCVGDINRDEAEERRGGGTVCRQDAAVWKAYRSAALQCETCGGEVQTCDKAARYR
uniref:Deoxyribonuclease-2-alpha n=1 Tax=Sinocyclocheilus grahami TaxID=75366 RepID=A0A672K3I1_SINGR